MAAMMAAVLLWFATISNRPLYEPDEGRYAQVPKEMVDSGDWITPRLNGIKFFDKPPLQYWATASAYTVFGPSEWTARAWSAMVGLFGVGMAWWAGKALYGRREGMAAAWVLGGAPLWILGSNLTTTDIGVASLLGSAVLVFAVARQTGNARLYPGIWLLLGLAFLAKGLIAVVLPAVTLLLYVVTTRQWRLLADSRFWRWSPLAMLVALPWLIAVSQRNPEFLHYFFVQEHFARFSSTVHARNKPWWFFIAVVSAGMIPWLGVMWRAAIFRRQIEVEGRFDTTVFLSIWALVVLAFFSVSHSKLPLYILPMLPPLAVLLGGRVLNASRRVLCAGFVAMALLGAGIALCLWRPEWSQSLLRKEVSDLSALQAWGFVSACALMAGGVMACRAVLVGRKSLAVAIAAVASLSGIQAGLLASRAFESLSVKEIGLKARTLRTADTELFNVGQIDRGLAFYSTMQPIVVQARGELDLGFTVEPERWVVDDAAFLRRWATPGHKLAVMRSSTYATLKAGMSPGTAEVFRRGANVLVERR
ncbi:MULTISPECIES: glycosyltransferase family 39 protein [Burkholderiaceae]|jgi:4-amino-4-deoxy-L-arabinose transferase-like glycosyltransferase|nr:MULTISPECIES: glycosyltransferase family 39 protein [Burkholderiaceae]AVA33758.1 glycosyltransferase family 39 protein [Cupriavidus metallidurans]KWW32461.1 Undecaprenyl phosphate-alpha-4-amino-4-deoxy-L-arabinose arabinosyl transferase [Cupriavidus metallidurans]MCA3183959.1 glycosyltransferase family 39 protein [Cupriavidus sp.]MCA3193993.1 glycosyltransferase family 39 protein [Cupriavidus sp.]MCA3198422.1 glycosyltransferase family 39 protein [Cupriavidus sp.]